MTGETITMASNGGGDTESLWTMVHGQNEKLNAQAQGLIETRSELRGLATQFRDFSVGYKTDIDELFKEIANVNKPKPSQLWQVVGVCLIVLGMFGTVLVYGLASSRELADVKFSAANELSDTKFRALQRELDIRLGSVESP